MISIDPSALQYTNDKWMDNPFHIGEITLQQHYKIQDHVMSYAPKFIRSYMPIEHQQFYTELPFLVAAIRDTNDNMWATLLENTDVEVDDNDDDGIQNKGQLVTLPTSKTLQIHARPVLGDALEGIFDSANNIDGNKKSIDVGLLGIQFETARRNRVNGRIYIADGDDHDNGATSLQPLLFHVDQSFGNCPQYIKPRQQWYRSKSTAITASPTSNNIEKRTTNNVKSFTTRLTTKQIEWIHTAETFFTATGYRNYNDTNNQDLMQYGNDASHRGGPPGFVRVIDADLVDHNNDTCSSSHQQQIMWTEFNGNNHFNSLGNLLLDPRIGLCFPNFENGSMLQISGVAILDMGDVQTGARQVHVQIHAINEVPAGSLPIRWGSKHINDDDDGDSKADGYTKMQITKIVKESDDVKSFYIQPLSSSKKIGKSVIKHQAGQHLPIRLVLDNGEVIDRRYSLSSNPNIFSTTTTSTMNEINEYYRISVKYHKDGKSSSYLHENMNVGSIIKVGKPGGTFTVQQPGVQISKISPIVLISAGIGITPLLSMLYELTGNTQNERMIYWFHGARNKEQHPFQEEIDQIYQSLTNKDLLQIHTFYTSRSDSINDDQIKDRSVLLQSGRITSKYIQEIVPNIESALIYICGPSSFIADISTGLEEYGGRCIYYETF